MGILSRGSLSVKQSPLWAWQNHPLNSLATLCLLHWERQFAGNALTEAYPKRRWQSMRISTAPTWVVSSGANTT